MPSNTWSKSNTSTLAPNSLWHRLSACASRAATVASLAICLLTLGCSHVNDPWRDSSTAINSDMRTPSAETYAAGDRAEFRARHGRTWPSAGVAYHNGAVSHWPLWFEDPFEDRGNTDIRMTNPDAQRDLPDNTFAMNGVDYLHIAYGPARELLNIAVWPISAVVEHPGMLKESNGRIDKNILGYDHDAKHSDSVSREPPDVAMLAPPYAHTESVAGEKTGVTDH